MAITTETMSIHRGLSEIKMIEKRLSSLLLNLPLIAVIYPHTVTINGSPIDTFKKNALGDLDRVKSLIARRNAIKAAISQSNATTTVSLKSVSSEKITVAQAIDLKNHAMEYVRLLLENIELQYNKSIKITEDKMAQLTQLCDKHIADIYGSAAASSSADSDIAKSIEMTRKAWMESNSPRIVDPCSLKSLIDKYSKMISEFEAEVDAVLSESNAITTITFTYDTHNAVGI